MKLFIFLKLRRKFYLYFMVIFFHLYETALFVPRNFKNDKKV